MVIEWLRIPVPRAEQDAYLLHDRAIWTKTLAAQPGFAGKECWSGADDPDMLHLVIRWESLAQWQDVPRPLLDATERTFVAAVGAVYPVADCLTYRVIEPTGRSLA